MKRIVLLYLAVSWYALAFSQSGPGLRNHVAVLTAIRQLKPIEKLYLQTDKPYYTTGDTLRFKAYLLYADYLTPSNLSGILYVELDDQSGKTAKRMMVPVTTGMAWGDIALDEKELPTGNYTLRAYTNWMRNFGEDYIYKQTIPISAATANALLVKANFAQQNNKVESILQFTSLGGHLQLLKDMELRVMNGKKNLSKDKLTTGVDGALKVNFDLPVTVANGKDNFSIIAKDVTKGTTNGVELTIPVNLNRPENTDIQFMPEGGSLVAGIKTKVGFKAISEDGKGTSVSGKIIDSKQNEVVSFKTSHAGMGSFEFTPKAGEVYTAKLNGITKTFALPAVSPTGITLRIESFNNNDSLNIVITATADIKGTYYLIGQARGVACYAQAVTFDGNGSVKKSAAKDLFPTGIARFTLLNADHQPVNERQVFINQNDNLQFSITTNKPGYGIRDSLALAITVKDKNGKPVKGDFSLAITDDNQVKTDSLGSNILNNLLFTSDLKGNIEEPGYYFNDPTKKQTDLDNLLLTQGWVGYNWQEDLKPTISLAYQPEKEFTVSGRVTNVFNKPIANSQVILLANHPVLVQDTITDKDGKFIFKGLFPVDTAIYKLQARNKRGKENNVGITMDEIKLPEFAPASTFTPWYVNTDTILLKNASAKSTERQNIANYKGEGRLLNEVTIKDRKTVKGSLNLNGPGGADQVLDEEEMNKAGKMSLADLLEKKIKGFSIGVFPSRSPIRQTYKLNEKEIHFIIDGMDLDFFYDDSEVEKPISLKRYFYLQSYLNYFTAEDITGIEVMYNPRFNSSYKTNFLSDPRKYGLIPPEKAFIEITTRAKKGPFMKVTPGTYLFKTLAFTLPKQFYAPKYTVKNKTLAMGTDMRSTLHWEPNVLTDANGRANVSFFTADKPAGYTVIIEGITGDGNIGYHRQKINIVTNAALK